MAIEKNGSYGEKSGMYYEVPENYIYISHLDDGLKFWKLPFWPDTISDTQQSTFQETNALGRSAPVYTYSQTGARKVQFQIELHRDWFDDVNMNWSNSKLGYGEDYVDNLIHALQAIALPKYNLSNKMVEPPLVAVRIGNEIFVKGVVTSAIGLTYEKPIMAGIADRYARVKLAFEVSEVDPYDATTVYKNGSFRGVVSTFKGKWPNGMNL